jgi:hypothetical protein
MSSIIRIIRAHDLIKATPEGRVDLAEFRKLILEITSAAASSVDYEILLDTRKARVEVSKTDLFFLASGLCKRLGAFARKTAVLCPLDRFDYAGFFALCAENRGLEVKAFTSFEEAIEWLIADGTGSDGERAIGADRVN